MTSSDPAEREQQPSLSRREWWHWVWQSAYLGCSLCGCGISTSALSAGKSHARHATRRASVLATTGMIADGLNHLLNLEPPLRSLMGTGVDPHLYRPTRRDVKRLLGAQLIVSNGLRLEGRMEELFDQLRRLGKHVWALGDLIPTQRLRYPGEGSHPDPHIWMDVGLWRHGLERLYEKLAADTFFQPWLSPERFTDYLRDLRELDVYIHGVIQSIPAVQRVLVTAHDAFGYFGRAYGIEVRGLQGVSTESEAGVHDVRSLIEFLVERKIPAIFVETSVNPRLVEAVLAGCRARHWPVQLGGTLFSDAMGPPGDYTGTYLGMMDANATTIARGLGGHVPPGGWRGLLPATAMSVHSNHAKSINS